jgi:oligoendopeptidase F
VNSLYAVYQNADAGFQPTVFRDAAAGGTKHHSELLKPFGLDAAIRRSGPDFKSACALRNDPGLTWR